MRPPPASAVLVFLHAIVFASQARAGSDAPAPIPSIAARTKGLTPHDGFLPWWWDAKAGKLLLQARPDGEELLYSASLAGGAGALDASLDRGQLGEMRLVRFERAGPRVLLVQEQLAHRSGDARPAATLAVERSFPASVLASLPVAAETKDAVVVDATSFVLHDFVALQPLRDAEQGTWKQDDDRSAFRPAGSGAFPRNTELEALVTVTSEKPPEGLAPLLPDGHSMTLVQHHSFLQLPPPGYAPREQDPRVGFFTTSFKDMTAPYREPIEKRLIVRWRLHADASGRAIEPIVLWLDPAIPEPARSTVRAAALWWNVAFGKAGLRDAIEVRDLPDGASLLDARYSGIQWTHRTERAWSVGQAQADPRTGEILHAVVLLDSHRRRTTDRIWRNLEVPAGCDAGATPELPVGVAGTEIEEDALVQARLAYLTAHEVGHALGLEHDMAATTFGWGSVMDYLWPHIELSECPGAKDGDCLDLSDVYPRGVGPYDDVAIAWGYRDDLGPAERAAALASARSRGVVFPQDSDARWNEYDFGDDPARWLATCRGVRRVLLDRFGPAQLRKGEALYTLQERFSLAYLYHRFAILAAQRQIGGELVANALAGDGEVPRRAVPAAVQAGALEELAACLSPSQLEVPSRIEEAMLPPPDGYGPTRERFTGSLDDAFDRVAAASALAGLVIEPLLSPQRAAALIRAEETANAKKGAPTLGDVVDTVLDATWDAPPERSARLASLQRASQRVALDALMRLGSDATAPPEARGLVLARLGDLASRLRRRRATDEMEAAHLRLARRSLAAYLAPPSSAPALQPAHAPAPPPGRPIGLSR